MICQTTTVEVNIGKNAAVAAWAQKMQTLISKQDNHEITVLQIIAASNQQVHFHVMRDTLARYEEYLAGVSADEQF